MSLRSLPMGSTGEWDSALRAWSDYQRTGGAPSTTVGLRLYHVRVCAREVGRSPEIMQLEDLTRWMAGKSWAPNTRRAYRASLRAFYAWHQPPL